MFLLKRLCALGLTVVVAATAACSGSSGGGRSRDTLVVYTGQAGDFQLNFNPFSPTQIEGIGTIYEPLFFYNIAKDQPPKPLLGTEFSWNADGTELSVDAAGGRDLVRRPEVHRQGRGVHLRHGRQDPGHEQTGFKGTATATDDTHVVVKFPEPAYMDGPHVLGQLWIMPEHIWKNYSAPATEVNRQPVGTGPSCSTTSSRRRSPSRRTRLLGRRARGQAGPLPVAVRQPGRGRRAQGRDRRLADRPDPGHQEHREELPRLRGRHVAAQPGRAVHLLQRAAGVPGRADRSGRAQGDLLRNEPHAGQHAGVPERQQRMSPAFTLLPRDTALVSSKLTDRMAPMSPETAKANELLDGAGWVKGADGIYAKDGKPLALTVEGGRRLDGLHHRDGHAEPAAAPDRRQDHPAAAVVERVGRRPGRASSSCSSTRWSRAPRLTRTTSTATSSPPRPRRRSGRRPPRTSRGSATPPWTTRSPS